MMESFDVLKTDVLVVGGGAAACMAAISAKNEDVDVLMLDKGQVGKSGCSPNAHGGMAICHKHVDDSWRVHMEDTLMSGAFSTIRRSLRSFARKEKNSVKYWKILDLSLIGMKTVHTVYGNSEVIPISARSSAVMKPGMRRRTD